MLGVPLEPGQVASLIQTTLVPVIMISAVGLIALVVQNRHMVVLERTFRVNARRLQLWEQLRELKADTHPLRYEWLRGQYEIQDALLSRWLQRGVFTRNALVGAFLGVFLFGLTSLDLVLDVLLGLRGNWDLVAVGFFIAGILSFLVCFGFVLVDVYQALQITRYENSLVSDLMEKLERADTERRAA